MSPETIRYFPKTQSASKEACSCPHPILGDSKLTGLNYVLHAKHFHKRIQYPGRKQDADKNDTTNEIKNNENNKNPEKNSQGCII